MGGILRPSSYGADSDLSRTVGATIARHVRSGGFAAVLAWCILAASIGASAPAYQLASSGNAPGGRPAKGKLLVASSDLEDPNFARCVVLLVAYSADEGAMGVIVNQPTPIKLAKILPD